MFKSSKVKFIFVICLFSLMLVSSKFALADMPVESLENTFKWTVE